ncbi:MAG: hypothetical protein ACRCZH_04225, partial [Cetobacterium sp.]
KITNREIANNLEVDEKKIATWKIRDDWNGSGKNDVVRQKKKCSTTKSTTKEKVTEISRKQKKEIAKVMIEEGYSISKVVEQTGIPRATVGRMSSKDNLQQSQLEYLNSFREQNRHRIRANKEKRLELNELAKRLLESSIKESEDIPKDFMTNLIRTEELEQKVFELDRIDKFERLELEKQKLELEKLKLKELDDDYDEESKTVFQIVGADPDDY